MNTSNEICKGCVNVSLDRNEWPCLDCCVGDRYNEPQPEADRPMQIPAVRRSQAEYIISNKKVQELYDIIHEEIMQVRIKLCNLPDKELLGNIDDYMGKLCYDAPEKAINLFKKK